MHISSSFGHDVLEASQRVYTHGTRNIYQVFINGLFITPGQWLCRQGCGRKNHKNLHHITMEIMTTKRISLWSQRSLNSAITHFRARFSHGIPLWYSEERSYSEKKRQSYFMTQTFFCIRLKPRTSSESRIPLLHLAFRHFRALTCPIATQSNNPLFSRHVLVRVMRSFYFLSPQLFLSS